MPTYEYECVACSHVFDAFQSMADEPLTECPLCGKAVKRRINGGTGIIFKGTGFYVNDSGKKPGASSKAASTASSGGSSAASSGT